VGILDTYADSIERSQLQSMMKPAPAPESSFSAWSFGKSGFQGIGSGAVDMAGSLADFLSSYGTVSAASFGTGADSDAAAARMRKGDTFDTAAGNVLRKKADDMMPDPHTAHMSELMLSGLTRFATKAVTEVGLFGGPVGAALLAADESNSAAQRLIQKGVDPATATLVGESQGLFAGLGAVMPLAGSTLAHTAGLIAVGGPLSFMAQEQLSKEILQNADYGAEAALHDPLDPVGLAVSTLVPAGFGAMGLRRAAKEAAAARRFKTEADIKAAAALTPAEQASSDSFERSAGNLAELRAEIDKAKRPEDKAALQAELDKQEAAARKAPVSAAAQSPEVADAARVALLDRTVAKSLPDDPAALAVLKEASDAVAEGRAVADTSLIDAQIKSLEDELSATIPAADGLAERGAIRQAREQLRLMEQTRVDTSDTAIRAEAKDIQGRSRLSYKEALAEARKRNADRDADWQAQSDRLNQFIEANAEAQKQTQRAGELEKQLQVLRQERLSAVQRGSADQRSSVTRESSNALPREVDTAAARDAKPTAVLAPEPKPSEYRAALDQAAELIKGKEPGQVAAEMNAGGTMTQLMHNALAAVEEMGGSAKKLGDIAAHAEDIARNVPSMKPGDALADAIDRVRQGLPAPEAEKLSPDQARLQQIAATKPDMPVLLPGMDKPITLADAIERIKREMQADLSDAELVRAAAACALSFGA
jgi:hypothetical protein